MFHVSQVAFCHFLLDIFQAIYTTHLESDAEPGLSLRAEPMVPSKGELHLGVKGRMIQRCDVGISENNDAPKSF